MIVDCFIFKRESSFYESFGQEIEWLIDKFINVVTIKLIHECI